MIRLLVVGLACLWLWVPAAFSLTLNRGNGAEPDTLDPQKYNLTVELNIIADLLSRVPYEEAPRAKVKLPKREKDKSYREPKHEVARVKERY